MVLQDIQYNGNKKIDNLIREIQSKINSYDDIVFEWIPYNQLDSIKEISKGDFATVYSAVWKDGPLHYNYDKNEYIRKSDKKITLKCIHNSQNITDEFLNEVWKCNLLFDNIISHLLFLYFNRLKNIQLV